MTRCKEGKYSTEYRVKCSIYFGEYFAVGIMYNALLFNKKSWDLVCLLPWSCNLFNHHHKSVKNKNQVACSVLSLKQQLELGLEQIF